MYQTFQQDANHADQHRAFSTIKDCVSKTKQWMTGNLIKFNESKTDAIVVCSKSSRCKPAALSLIVGEFLFSRLILLGTSESSLTNT